MEYIISQDSAPTGDLYEDETFCTRGLCAHPSCWESHIRSTRGFKKYISSATAAGSTASGTPRSSTYRWATTESSLSDDDGLSTLKVMNMLDEYGESPKDLYPSRYAGQPTHKRYTEPSRNLGQNPSLATPSTSSAFRKAHLFDDLFQSRQRDVNIKPVEVQEVFDLDELSQNWDSTFITKPVYVWVPAKNKRRKKTKKTKSTSRKHSSLPEGVTMKDVTNEMLPRGHVPQNMPPMQTSRQRVIPRSKSPIPTGGQPYHNVGQTPKDRMRFRVIMNELKDLPRPFVLEVLEKARGLEKKEDVLMLMERYLKTMKKSDWELSMVTGKVLQQQRLSNRVLEESERLPAAPSNSKMYKLDEAQAESVTEPALTAIPADVMTGSMSATHKYLPLPVIGERRLRQKNTVRVHVSTSTKESVKPFQYKKQSDVEFCLGPTRTLSANTSRPDSRGTAQSAPPPTIPGADMSVLYDQESVERNANNNAIDTTAKRRATADGAGESGTSSAIPKAPAGTPYTPKTPYRPAAEVKAELNESSPNGVALDVIQETAAVDEFPKAPKRTPSFDLHLTTKSVIETSSPNVYTVKRRVVSASSPRMHREDSSRRGQSANASMAVIDMSSLAQLDQDATSVSAPGRATTSRLEIVSTTSQWPIVDEEALLREQTTAELVRAASAPVSKHSKDGVNRSSTLPADAKETGNQTRAIVVDMPSLKQPQNSPAPPPPSPEPADKVLRHKQPTEYPDGQPVMADVGLANITEDEQVVGDEIDDRNGREEGKDVEEKPTNAEEKPTSSEEKVTSSEEKVITAEKKVTSAEEKVTCNVKKTISEEKEDKFDPKHGDIAAETMPEDKQLTGNDVAAKLNQSAAEEKANERQLTENFEFDVQSKNTSDPLSLVPDDLYKEMDMERRLTLSALPPNLDTPECPISNRPPKLVNSEPAPDVASVMKLDDQGGLSGQ